MSAPSLRPFLLASLSLASLTASAAAFSPQGLPPAPAPPENPITAEKAMLGKILFWDEQLSSDGTVSCGTCHRPTSGASDPRDAFHPGADLVFGTTDDVLGSLGIIDTDSTGAYQPSGAFGLTPQVTPRATPSNLMSPYFSTLTWSGLAEGTFVDPQTGTTMIVNGGALESHASGPPIITVEMAHRGRDWNDIAAKIAKVKPLAVASNLPPDIVQALTVDPTYADLMTRAYGDPAVTSARIIFALATYQRSVIPDQTPWDQFIAGNTNALTADEQAGLALFNGKAGCVQCHVPPVFSDDTFRNTGLRPFAEDLGRFAHTNNLPDLAAFKVPSLRNAGLRPRFMHTGEFSTLAEVVDFYDAGGGAQLVNKDPALVPLGLTATEKIQLLAFLDNGLTDQRVANAQAPFDRPTLFSESGVPTPFGGSTAGTGGFVPRMLATAPFNIGNDDFKIGLADALGGTTVIFATSNAAGPPGFQFRGIPINISLLPPFQMSTKMTSGTGPGGGYVTVQAKTPADPSFIGTPVFSQWFVLDPAAPGFFAASQAVGDELF